MYQLGIDALVHAIESYVSIFATDFTSSMSTNAIEILLKYLPRAYSSGNEDPRARERVHYAATIAGIAFGNAFLGICHSMAHKFGSEFHVPHGLSCALFISHVIAYNSTDAPLKMGTFPQYEYPQSKERYANIATKLNLNGNTDDEKVASLINAIEDLKASVDIPPTVKDVLGESKKEKYFAAIPNMAEMAFDDQCTSANPRYPLIKDIEKLFEVAWEGRPTL